MKKVLTILLVLVCAFAVFADTYTSSRGTNDAENSGTTDGFPMLTTKEKPILNLNTTGTKFKGPVLITSLGQGIASATMSACFKAVPSVQSTLANSAHPAEAAGFKTIVFGVAKSGKGLGSAGVTIDEEIKRANEFADYLKAHPEVNCIVAHTAGSMYRGGDSDKLLSIIMPYADYLLVVEEADFDHLFTNFSNEKKVPTSLVFANKNLRDVVKGLF